LTYKDLIDTVVMDSGDAGTNYRVNALRWLNLARQDAVAMGSWKSAKNSAATLTTNAAQTDGIYALTGIDEVIGGQMYDQTAHSVVERDTENLIMRMEVNPDQFGPPVLWADAGMTSAGEKQIRFWPIPEDERILAFLGTKALTDITSDQEALTIDPYFGALTGVGTMLQAGLRYYHDLNNNEDVSTIGRSQGTFHKMIKALSGQSGVDANAGTRLDPVNRRSFKLASGRLDPGHYGNG
jgi:hypothetical protein